MCRSGSITRVMRRSRLFLLTLLVAAIAPATASAVCPTGPGPIWADYAAFGVYNTPVENVLARPGTLLGVQNEDWADSYRSAGADTAGWHMRLLGLVGSVNSPKPKSQVLAKVPELVSLAREHHDLRHAVARPQRDAGRPDPRADHVGPAPLPRERLRAVEGAPQPAACASSCSCRGSRSTTRATRATGATSRSTPTWSTRRTRGARRRKCSPRATPADAASCATRWTDAMKRLKQFVVPARRAGLMIPFWSHHDRSGREGLSDAAWFRLTRIKTLAAGDVGRNRGPRDALVVGLADEPASGRGRRGQAARGLPLPATPATPRSATRPRCSSGPAGVDSVVSEC